MRLFDYSFLEKGMLPSGLLNVTNAITELKTKEAARKSEFERIFTKLESIARVQSVRGSNAIEGIVTSEKRIAEIVNGSSAPLNHDEAEIAGYRDALNLIHSGHENLDVREGDILQLHRVMLSYTPAVGGEYKTSDNVIMEIDAAGRRRVRFAPLSAKETSDAMKQLLLAYMDARSNYAINGLLLIPCFILDFLCIHPFSDGNGRMSRLLSLLMMYNSGFDAGKYISFEEQINNFKGMYYEALRASSVGWHTNENSYFPFIENFLTALLMCYKELDKRFAIVQGGKASKRDRVEATVMNSLLPVSKKEICYILPDVSKTTVEAVLAQMLKNGVIEKVGASVNTKYIKNRNR